MNNKMKEKHFFVEDDIQARNEKMIKFDWYWYPKYGICISLDGVEKTRKLFKRNDLLNNLEEINEQLIGEIIEDE